jgi:hypothetical protein
MSTPSAAGSPEGTQTTPPIGFVLSTDRLITVRFMPHLGPRQWLVPVVVLVAVYFTLTGNATIVTMLLVGYSFVTQLFPAVIVSLMPRNPTTPAGAFAGILVAAVLSFTHATVGSLFPALPQAIRDLNVGIIALAANIVAMVVVSSVMRPRAILAGAV